MPSSLLHKIVLKSRSCPSLPFPLPPASLPRTTGPLAAPPIHLGHTKGHCWVLLVLPSLPISIPSIDSAAHENCTSIIKQTILWTTLTEENASSGLSCSDIVLLKVVT